MNVQYRCHCGVHANGLSLQLVHLYSNIRSSDLNTYTFCGKLGNCTVYNILQLNLCYPSSTTQLPQYWHSCNAYPKSIPIRTGQNTRKLQCAYCRELFCPLAANQSTTPWPSFSLSTVARSRTTWPIWSHVYLSIFTIMHLSCVNHCDKIKI